MARLCIIQLTRTGDLIQTYQAVQAFRQASPESRVDLVCFKRFSAPARALLEDVFESIDEIDQSHLPQKSDNGTLHTSALDAFVKDLSQRDYQVLINLSHSKFSTYISSLIEARYRLGPYRGPSGEVLIPDTTSQYIYSNILEGPYNRFNLVDLFKAILGVKPGQSSPMSWPRPECLDERIVVQPLASHDRKHWSMTRWSQALEFVLRGRENLRVSLIGGRDEEEKLRALKESSSIRPFQSQIDLEIGRPLEEITALINRSVLFWGHDSLGSHLAALAGTPAIVIPLGTARPYETAPYSVNTLIALPRTPCFPCGAQTECSYFQCHVDAHARAVAALVADVVDHGEVDVARWQGQGPALERQGLEFYQTSFTSLGLTLAPVHTPKESSFYQALSSIYHAMWSLYLFDIDLEQDLPQLGPKAMEKAESFSQGLESLFSLCEFAKKYSQYLLEGLEKQDDQQQLQQSAQKLTEIDQLQKILRKQHPHLAPLIDFFTVVFANLEGTTQPQLIGNGWYSYHEFGLCSSALYELINKVLRHSRGEAALPAEASGGEN